MAAQQSGLEKHMASSVADHSRLAELLSPKLPFGLPSGKQTMSSNQYIAKSSGN